MMGRPWITGNRHTGQSIDIRFLEYHPGLSGDFVFSLGWLLSGYLSAAT